VQNILKQGGKTKAVQPVATEPSVSYEVSVGVVVHLSKTREKQINISSIEWRQQTKTLLTETGVELGKAHNMKVIDNFETFPKSINMLPYD
jgi:hypothetical protein